MKEVLDRWIAPWARGEWGRSLFPVLAILLAYRLLDFAVMRSYNLPAEAYERPWILWSLAAHWWPVPMDSGRDALILLAWPAAIAYALTYRRELLAGWSAIEQGEALRSLTGIFALTLAWALSSYDYNLYFDQGHLADRLLLLVLAALAWVRPIAVVPLVLVAAAVVGQFEHPLGGFRPTHIILIPRLLMLLGAMLVVRAVGVSVHARTFVWLSLILVASGYWSSGLGKLTLGWLAYGHSYNLLFAPYANGWLAFLDPDQIAGLGRTLARVDPLLTAGIVVLEIGVLGILWSRATAVGLLLLGASFHLGVLAMSGIFFWMWIIVDGALALWLLSAVGRRVYPAFARRDFFVSLALIPLAVLWFRTAGLSWLDVPVSYTYRFEAVGESGGRYSLPPRFFSPYEYQFTLSTFAAWSRDPLLQIAYGASRDLSMSRRLLDARTRQEIARLEAEYGRVPHDEERGLVRERFVGRWVARYYERGGKQTWLTPLAAPLHVNAQARGEVYAGQEPVERVEVHRVTSFFNGRRYDEFDETLVRTIRVQPRDTSRLVPRHLIRNLAPRPPS